MIRYAAWMEAEQSDPYVNLAIEQQLMKDLPADTAVLYLWQNDHTIVIGRNQDPWTECRVEAFMADGGRIARRLSGGGAVYHDLGNLNFTLIVPPESFDIPRQMNIVLEAARSLGLHPAVNGRNDLVIDGRKFSGNAFQVQKKAACHHGTLLIDSDTAAMERWLTADRSKLACHGVQSVAARIVNLHALCPDVNPASAKQALLHAFSQAYGLSPVRLMQAELDGAGVQETAARLASTDWLFPQEASPASVESTRRFVWGNLRVRLWLRDGRIQCASLHTDALETQLFPLLEGALRQARWEGENIRRQLEKSPVHLLSDGQKRMAQDVLGWLQELSS